MTTENTKDVRKLEELLKEMVTRTVDMWEAGEGDLVLEIRDDGGDRKAKIKGGFTKRIR